MIKKQRLWAKILLALLTLCGIYSVYCAAFCIWMTAIPREQALLGLWQTQAYIWLTESILIGLCWIALLVWLFLQRRKGKKRIA